MELLRPEGLGDTRVRATFKLWNRVFKRSVPQQPIHWIACGPTRLEIPYDAGNGAVFSQFHDREQRHTLTGSLGHLPGARVVPVKIAFQLCPNVPAAPAGRGQPDPAPARPATRWR